MEAPLIKQCKTCHEEKTLDNYYRTRKGHLLGACRVCTNRANAAYQKAKYVPSPIKRGFAGLPEEKRAAIFADVQSGKALSIISREQNVGLDALRKWKSMGKITAPTPPE